MVHSLWEGPSSIPALFFRLRHVGPLWSSRPPCPLQAAGEGVLQPGGSLCSRSWAQEWIRAAEHPTSTRERPYPTNAGQVSLQEQFFLWLLGDSEVVPRHTAALDTKCQGLQDLLPMHKRSPPGSERLSSPRPYGN